MQENSGPPRVLTNNALVTPNANNRPRLSLQCVTNSTRSDDSNAVPVGDVIATDSSLLTAGTTYNNQIEVAIGSVAHGYLSIFNLASSAYIDTSSQGVYTCRVYDDNDNLLLFNIGIYPTGFNSESSSSIYI